ncbi:hypothetical protein NM092_000531 [Vibrio cholerae]|nr:hypothetical protein [Vibrio cholerae]
MSNMNITVYRAELVEMLKDEGFPVDQIPNFISSPFFECVLDGTAFVKLDIERALSSPSDCSVEDLEYNVSLLFSWCFWVLVFNRTTDNHSHFQAVGAIRSITLASCARDIKQAKRMAEWWEECQPVIGTSLEAF